MNIMKFFRGGAVEQATVGRSESDHVLDELAAEEKRQREIQAEQIVREKRQTEEYRARNAKTLADFLKRKDFNTQQVNAHVAALLLVLTDTRALVIESANVPFDGTVSTTEEVFGFPLDFPDKITAAIREAAPQTSWDFSGEGFLAVKPGQPKLKEPPTIRLPRFANHGPPPGYSGTWDLVNDRPME